MVVDAVVCARGERARTFVPVVRALRKGARGRVILVDDGNNRGLWRAELAGATIVKGPQCGKAAAMRAGLFYVTTPRVIFADADITGFRARYARRLARDNGGQIAGLRDNGSVYLGPVPPITGERSVPTWLAAEATAGAIRYEAETVINGWVGRAGLPAETFTMRGVTNPSKEPLRRTGQVLRAAAGHLLGLMQYAVAWCVTALASAFTR